MISDPVLCDWFGLMQGEGMEGCALELHAGENQEGCLTFMNTAGTQRTLVI
jgi:hypothetical protein